MQCFLAICYPKTETSFSYFCFFPLGCKKSEGDVIKDVINMVRKDIGPVAAFKKVIVLPTIPKVCLSSLSSFWRCHGLISDPC